MFCINRIFAKYKGFYRKNNLKSEVPPGRAIFGAQKLESMDFPRKDDLISAHPYASSSRRS